MKEFFIQSKEWDDLDTIVEESEKKYLEGHSILAFVILQQTIEFQLQMLWHIHLVKTLRENYEPSNEFLNINATITVLSQLRIIDDAIKSNLIALKKGRNDVVHFALNLLKKTEQDKTALDDQFKKGVTTYKNLVKLRQEHAKTLPY